MKEKLCGWFYCVIVNIWMLLKVVRSKNLVRVKGKLAEWFVK